MELFTESMPKVKVGVPVRDLEKEPGTAAVDVARVEEAGRGETSARLVEKKSGRAVVFCSGE